MSTIGLMLGGGGAKGSYQLGVIKALIEEGLYKDVSCVSGTSIGAINAFLLASIKTFDEILSIWKLLNNKNIFKSFRRDYQGFFDLNALRDTIAQQIDLDYFHTYPKDIFVTATKMPNSDIFNQVNLLKVTREVFHLNYYDDPIDATMASAAIPYVFGTKKIGENYYVDGGLVDQNPYEPLLNMGCDLIFSVPLGKKVKGWFDYKSRNFIDIDFLIPNHFFVSTIGDLAESVNFSYVFKHKNFWLGYFYARALIQKLFTNKTLFYDEFGHLATNAKPSYKRYNLTFKEILLVKQALRVFLKEDDDTRAQI
ncbi:MAG: patatin-like phospholipase family protein [Acholeplasmatales bacterium]|jgi:NTE family protein|nr:patatin-like phospholipase family protein [Acholeplasmatales bacterium]